MDCCKGGCRTPRAKDRLTCSTAHDWRWHTYTLTHIHACAWQVVGTFHGVPLAEVPGVGPVELGFELLVETQEQEQQQGGGEGQQEGDEGQPQVAVTVSHVGLVLEAVAPAMAAQEEGAAEEEEEEGDEEAGDEQSLPSLPPHAVGAQQEQQQPQPQPQPPRRAKRHRLQGEQVLHALGYLIPRLMWH